MSKTKPVTYKDISFWVYDVAFGIFLKLLIDKAIQCTNPEYLAWLSDCIPQWRVNAIVSDFAFHFDSQLSAEQLQVILRLIDESCLELAKRESIPAQEMEAWNILDGKGIDLRGHSEFPTAPVIELGRAMQELLCGTLPPAPVGTWWFYGTETGRRIIAMKPYPTIRP
jgi:hypothetical protein